MQIGVDNAKMIVYMAKYLIKIFRGGGALVWACFR